MEFFSDLARWFVDISRDREKTVIAAAFLLLGIGACNLAWGTVYYFSRR